jgi:hypothetical protein
MSAPFWQGESTPRVEDNMNNMNCKMETHFGSRVLMLLRLGQTSHRQMEAHVLMLSCIGLGTPIIEDQLKATAVKK